MTPEEEERGWEELKGRWEEEGAHRAFLASFTDLDGLARAGGRYRAVLAERPDDPVAARWRDEVVKRATVAGIASLPRSSAPREVPRWLRRGAILSLSAVLAWAAFWAVQQLAAFARGR